MVEYQQFETVQSNVLQSSFFFLEVYLHLLEETGEGLGLREPDGLRRGQGGEWVENHFILVSTPMRREADKNAYISELLEGS